MLWSMFWFPLKSNKCGDSINNFFSAHWTSDHPLHNLVSMFHELE